MTQTTVATPGSRRTNPNELRAALLALSLVCAVTGSWAQAEEHLPAYVLGVGPFLPPDRLELTFGPMAARFGEALGREVIFRTSTTFERYTENVMAEEYDFALVSPFLFLKLDPGSYVPLARAPGLVRGEFIVLESSPLQTVADLAGKVVAVGPTGSGIELLMMHTLLEESLDPQVDLELHYFETPLSCLQQLLAETASACVTNFVERERFTESMNVRLNIIGQTIGVPRSPLVAHRRVDAEARETIRALLTSWRDDPRNQLPVSGAQVPNLIPVETQDYQPVLQILRNLRDR